MAALVHEYFGALAGSAGAQMALGHRFLFGSGVRASCEAALPYYELAAAQVTESGTGDWKKSGRGLGVEGVGGRG